MKIIKAYDNGKKVDDIALEEGLSHSTISPILKGKNRILEAVKGAIGIKSTILTKKRRGPIHKMEKLWIIWIEGQIQKRIPMSLLTIQMKGHRLFENLKAQQVEDRCKYFNAIKGWFHCFRCRFGSHDVHITEEAGGADVEAAEKFKDGLDKIIQDEEYLQVQIFSVDETGLSWKRTSERTYTTKRRRQCLVSRHLKTESHCCLKEMLLDLN
ncbi:tigger transposable element-derived protein 1-like [Trichechus inunguis]